MNTARQQASSDEKTDGSHAGVILRLASNDGRAAEKIATAAKGNNSRVETYLSGRSAALRALRNAMGIMIVMSEMIMPRGIADGPKRPTKSIASTSDMTAAPSCPKERPAADSLPIRRWP